MRYFLDTSWFQKSENLTKIADSTGFRIVKIWSITVTFYYRSCILFSPQIIKHRSSFEKLILVLTSSVKTLWYHRAQDWVPQSSSGRPNEICNPQSEIRNGRALSVKQMRYDNPKLFYAQRHFHWLLSSVWVKNIRQYSRTKFLLSTREGKRIWNGPRSHQNPVTLKRWRAGFFVLPVPKAIALFEIVAEFYNFIDVPEAHFQYHGSIR